MDFISILPHPGFIIPRTFLLGLPAIVLGLVGLFVTIRVRLSALPTAALLVTCLGVVAGGFVFSSSVVRDYDQKKDAYEQSVASRSEQVTADVEDRYDIALDASQLRELEYPSKKPSDPEVFGTSEVLAYDGAELTATTVRLAWTGKNFVLLTDGTPGSWSELPTR